MVLLLNWVLGISKNIFIKNIGLFLVSILFYTWGEAYYAVIICCSIFVNYIFGFLIDRIKTKSFLILSFGVSINLLILIYFKYFNFILDNINVVLKAIDLPLLANKPVHLPIGISFFTFQAISYLVDVYRKRATVQKNPLTVGLYIAMFPQLIAGPIVRYESVDQALRERKVTFENYLIGIKLFILGLVKKVIIADTMAYTVDHIAAFKSGEISTPLAWVFVTSYALQIFFDFSGYSDMAIGLGKIFGFEFPINFNQPYSSRSVREFWRRWHISLSTWFRDYVYIPLGGNRKTKARTYLNLLMVFFLTGIWHGASWNFLVWGLIHGFFLMLERMQTVKKLLSKLPEFLKNIYLLLVVIPAWVFFRITSFSDGLSIAGHLFVPFNPAPTRPDMFVSYYLDPWFVLVFISGIIFSLWRWDRIKEYLVRLRKKKLCHILELTGWVLLFWFSLATVISTTYNPFIYFQF